MPALILRNEKAKVFSERIKVSNSEFQMPTIAKESFISTWQYIIIWIKAERYPSDWTEHKKHYHKGVNEAVQWWKTAFDKKKKRSQ